MSIKESGEMYLETILILSKRSNFVRSIDIVQELDFSKPSVSRAVSLLKQGGYITVDKNGAINLTEIGLEIAEKIYNRHQVITKLLVLLGVSEKTAAEDACKIEHDISDESFKAISRYMKAK